RDGEIADARIAALVEGRAMDGRRARREGAARGHRAEDGHVRTVVGRLDVEGDGCARWAAALDGHVLRANKGRRLPVHHGDDEGALAFVAAGVSGRAGDGRAAHSEGRTGGRVA